MFGTPMMGNITTTFDERLSGFIVAMDGTVSLDMLVRWTREFELLLERNAHDGPVPLLIDTGEHDFEQPKCLAALRSFLSENAHVVAGISRVAFIYPARFRPATIVSDYFEDLPTARKWIETF